MSVVPDAVAPPPDHLTVFAHEARWGGCAAKGLVHHAAGAGERLEAVFDPFMQVGRRLNGPEAGVGLGLAISRDLACRMGGDLRASSREGSGSTFTLTLPPPPTTLRVDPDPEKDMASHGVNGVSGGTESSLR